MSVNDSLLSFYGLGQHSTIFKIGDNVRLRPFPIKHQIPFDEKRMQGGVVTKIYYQHHTDEAHSQLIGINGDGYTSGFWWEIDE